MMMKVEKGKCPFCVHLISNTRTCLGFNFSLFNDLYHFLCLPEQRSSPQVTRLRLQMYSTHMWCGSVCVCVCVCLCVRACVYGRKGVWQEECWSSEAFLMSQEDQCQRRWLWWMPFRKQCLTMTSAWRNRRVSKRWSWPSGGCCHEGDPLNHYLCTQVLLWA